MIRRFFRQIFGALALLILLPVYLFLCFDEDRIKHEESYYKEKK